MLWLKDQVAKLKTSKETPYLSKLVSSSSSSLILLFLHTQHPHNTLLTSLHNTLMRHLIYLCLCYSSLLHSPTLQSPPFSSCVNIHIPHFHLYLIPILSYLLLYLNLIITHSQPFTHILSFTLSLSSLSYHLTPPLSPFTSPHSSSFFIRIHLSDKLSGGFPWFSFLAKSPFLPFSILLMR